MLWTMERLTAGLAHRYRIDRELGRGGMAIVCLAEDLKHHRPVAIKVLKPEVGAVLGADRFLREIEVSARLHHPHIVPLYDSGEAAGFLFYVMPYVDGESLRDRLSREPQLPVDDALRITREVADALSYAHSHDIVHRDLKPENILLDSGHAVVADFGIARAVSAAGGERLTATGLAIGTPAYMSPEQAGGADVSGRSDIYSLGCVLYEMLAGVPPFSGPSAQAILARHATDPAPPITTLRPTVPDALVLALEKALAKVPADRFATATEFGQALTAPTPPAPAPRIPEPSRISPALLLILGLVFGGALAVAGGSTAAAAVQSLFGYAGTWATLMAGIWFLFERAEETLAPGTRTAVTRWLENLPATPVERWPRTFADMFDRIFGERHFSWKCFRRSCLASLAAVVVLALVWATLDPTQAGRLARLNAAELGVAFTGAVLLLALVNFIPDYLSLLETRWVIRRMTATGAVARFLALDLVATALIAISPWLVIGVLAPSVDMRLGAFMDTVLTFEPTTMGPTVEDQQPFLPTSVWYYSAFFTSVWVWLYALAGGAINVSARLGGWLGRVSALLDVRRQPLRSMGIAAMLIVTLLFVAGLPIVAL